MKITTRKSHGFIELTVDESQETIYRSDKNEVDDLICNLLSVIDDLSSYTDKSVTEYVNELGF